MNSLNENDVEKYLKFGCLTQPFLDSKFVLEKVMIDYELKLQEIGTANEIESLMRWIKFKIKLTKDEQLERKYKFLRTAKEIWESGFATGCTDYAILFATFARQINIPTTFLHTLEYNSIKQIQKGEKIIMHRGHSFCECYFNNEWILVDPTFGKIERLYNCKNIELSYFVGNSKSFVAYYRDLDLGKKQTIAEHNKQEINICKELKL